jgi:hypothetical protein
MKAIGMSAAAVCVLLGIAAPGALADDKVAVVKTTDGDRKVIWMKSRAKTWDTEHKTWVVRGGYQGYRVPDDKFSLYFGPEHTFRINSLPYRMVGSEPQFQYNGYWMTVVDPWPESWADTWYDSDDVYVRYDNGYYLYNTKYPDVGLSLRFSNK